jgi:hypothetical protein
VVVVFTAAMVVTVVLVVVLVEELLLVQQPQVKVLLVVLLLVAGVVEVEVLEKQVPLMETVLVEMELTPTLLGQLQPTLVQIQDITQVVEPLTTQTPLSVDWVAVER